MTDKLTVTLSVTSTDSQTKTDTDSWTVQSQIVTAPGQTQSIQIFINTQSTTASFTYSYAFSGYVPIWFEDQIDIACTGLGPSGGKHWLWFIPVDTVIDAAASTGDASCAGFTSYPSTFTGVGTYSGLHGVNTVLVTTPISQLPCNSTQEGRRILRTGMAVSEKTLLPPLSSVISFLNSNFTKRMKRSNPAFKFLNPETRRTAKPVAAEDN